jgi:hypothetical protein
MPPTGCELATRTAQRCHQPHETKHPGRRTDDPEHHSARRHLHHDCRFRSHFLRVPLSSCRLCFFPAESPTPPSSPSSIPALQSVDCIEWRQAAAIPARTPFLLSPKFDYDVDLNSFLLSGNMLGHAWKHPGWLRPGSESVSEPSVAQPQPNLVARCHRRRSLGLPGLATQGSGRAAAARRRLNLWASPRTVETSP